MQLYYTPGTCSLSPHIVAREAGIDIDLVKVDLATKLTETGADYRRINPKGSVPALAIGEGRMLTEGPALVQYLADLRPASGLAPANGSFERYRLQEWLNWVSTELHKAFSPLWRKDTPPEVQEASKEALAQKFAYLDQHLGTSPYLLADFSIADAYAFAVLGWAKFFAIDLARWPNIAAYVARIAARPAVRAALAAEGLIDAEAA